MFQHFAPAAADQGKKCATSFPPLPFESFCFVRLLLTQLLDYMVKVYAC